VFENGLLRKSRGPKRDEVTREWRRLHNEELYDLYPTKKLSDKLKQNKMGTQHIWRGGKLHTGFWWRNMRNETTWKT
jgi:hypothetical protein